MTISRIDDIDDERLAPFARLTERQLRNVLHPEESLVVCESLYVIALVARLGLPLVSVLVDERHLDNLLESAPEISGLDVDVYVATRDVLSQITGFELTRGYLAASPSSRASPTSPTSAPSSARPPRSASTRSCSRRSAPTP